MNEYLDMLGRKAKDRVTGFSGVVASVCFDLYGCVQVVLTPEADKDGKLADGHWFDAKRVAISGKARVMAPPQYAAMSAGAEIGAADKPPPASPPSR